MKTRGITTPENWEKLKHHRFAGAYVYGEGVDMDKSTAHMRTYGYDVQESIVLFEGKILDGRHRLDWAIKSEKTPSFREFLGTVDEAIAFVKKKGSRQHLTESQLAIGEVELQRFRTELGSVPDSCPVVPLTQSEMAENAGVSEKRIREASKVLEKGAPALQEAVKAGRLAVSDAAKIADESPKLQERAIKAVEEGKATTVSQAVKRLTGGKKPVLCEQCRTSGKPIPNCKNCRMAENAEKKRKAEAKAQANGEPTELKDQFGNIVPKRCRDAYADPWIQDTIAFLSEIVASFWQEKFADGMNKRKKRYPFIESKDFIDGCGMVGNTLDQLVEHLEKNRPAAVCPECQGKGCGACIQSGLLPRAAYEKLKK